MSVAETVADIVTTIRAARQSVQGEWSDGSGLVGWVDEDGADRILIARRRTTGPRRSSEEWLSHPAVFMFEDDGRYTMPPVIALASWALDDGALDAVLAAGVDAAYARDAHGAGVTDAWVIIGGWEAGIPVEYLGALS